MLCDILEILCGGLCLFETKGWPIVSSFNLGRAFKRMCNLPIDTVTSKLHAHALSIISRVHHHMIKHIFLPKGGHRDKVSYYVAFSIDSDPF